MEEAAQEGLSGILGVMDPFTALGMRSRMRAGGVPDATLGQVFSLWEAYQDAILEKKLSPFFKDADWLPTFNDLHSVTGFPKMVVSAFLVALRAHADETGDLQYLDPSKGVAARQKAKETVKEVVRAPMATVREALKPAVATTADLSSILTRPLGFVALAAVSVAVVYALYQFSPAFKAAKRKRKR